MKEWLTIEEAKERGAPTEALARAQAPGEVLGMIWTPRVICRLPDGGWEVWGLDHTAHELVWAQVWPFPEATGPREWARLQSRDSLLSTKKDAQERIRVLSGQIAELQVEIAAVARGLTEGAENLDREGQVRLLLDLHGEVNHREKARTAAEKLIAAADAVGVR